MGEEEPCTGKSATLAFTVSTVDHIMTRKSAIERRMDAQHRLMDELEPWRHLDEQALELEIWKQVPENARRWTDPKPHIASTTDTVVAFLSGKRPTITTTPRNAILLDDTKRADFNERIGTALFDTLDRDRSVSMLAESAEYCVHRGAIVGKYLYLSPEERGEERETYYPETAPLPSEGEEVAAQEIVTGEKVFPVDVQLLDPRDCGWILDSKDRVIEFVHCITLTYAELCADFPDLYEHSHFDQYRTPEQADAQFQVWDYWNKDINAIVCDGVFIKQPTPHLYKRIPFVVELPKTRKVQDGGSGAGAGLSGQRRSFRVGTPFCYAMLGSIRNLSWVDSIRNSYLEEIAIATMVMSDTDPEDSFYFERVTDSNDPDYGKTRFIFQPEIGPGGRVIPLKGNKYGGEKIDYMKPPQAVEVFQERAMMSQRDLALVSFPEGMLSGSQVMDVSGYAYSQMKQAALARIEPYRMALDRFWSRMMEGINEVIVDNWDYLGSEPLLLTMLGAKPGISADEPMEVTVDVFEAVGSIRVTIIPEIPINQEQEWGLYIQMFTVGLLSAMQVLDKTGVVQDPAAEIERVAFETFMKADPATMAAVAMQYMQRNGITPSQPAAPPAPPAAGPSAPAAPTGADPMMGGPMPVDPAMMGGAPLPVAPGTSPLPLPGGVPGSAGSGAPPIPPEVMAMLQQMLSTHGLGE